jgi:hypothetical protein
VFIFFCMLLLLFFCMLLLLFFCIYWYFLSYNIYVIRSFFFYKTSIILLQSSVLPRILSTKCCVDEMLCRRNAVSTKCCVDEVLCRRNAVSTKCCVDEVLCRRKFLDEILFDEVSCRRSAVSAKIFRQKFVDHLPVDEFF